MAQEVTSSGQTAFAVDAAEVQPDICNHLLDTLAAGRLASSLLFSGRKGVGKWLVAQEIAQAATCLASGSQACGKCDSCRQAGRFLHPDIQYLFPLSKTKGEERYLPYLEARQDHPFSDASGDVTSFITIDAIRAFQTRLAHRPSLSKVQVGIIFEAERMLPAAMDSLLKTLEEPPPYSYLIVVTDQPRFLHATIHSRLMRINFPPLNNQFVTEYLSKFEGIDEDQAQVLSRLACGTLYNIEKMVDGDFFAVRRKAWEMFSHAFELSAADFEIKYASAALLRGRDDVQQLCFHWQNFLRDLMILTSQAANAAESANLINSDMTESYGKTGECLRAIESFEDKINLLEAVKNHLRRNVNPRMAAFKFLLRLRNW